MDETLYLQHHIMEQNHWWFQGRFNIILNILSALDLDRQKTIVDIGCGTGGMTDHLSKYFKCIGVDTSQTAIKLAQKTYPSTQFELADSAHAILNLGENISLVLLLDVLEHIENDDAFFSALIHSLPAKTHVLITVPADPTLWSQHDITAQHFRRYTHKTLPALWESHASMVNIRLFSYYNFRLHPIIKSIRKISNSLKIATRRNGSDFRHTPPFINRILTNLFSGEAKKLVAAIDSTAPMPYKNGVSLIALLRKD